MLNFNKIKMVVKGSVALFLLAPSTTLGMDTEKDNYQCLVHLPVEEFKNQKKEEAVNLASKYTDYSKSYIPPLINFDTIQKTIDSLKNGNYINNIIYDNEPLLPEGGSQMALTYLERIHTQKGKDLFGGLILNKAYDVEVDLGIQKMKFVYNLYHPNQTLFESFSFYRSQLSKARASVICMGESESRNILELNMDSPLTVEMIRSAYKTKIKEHIKQYGRQSPLNHLQEAKDVLLGICQKDSPET